MYDIIFISYNEVYAEENFAKLKDRFPLVKRVTNVQGIHNAHIAAARKSFTKMFWVVDADAIILETFDFKYQIPGDWDLETVHVWRSRNPVNNLEYGYGGVKLLPKKLTLSMDTLSVDMTTNISKNFKIMDAVSNITAFNTDEYSTWRSAFRECAKLAVIADSEATERLDIWCNVAQGNYAEFAIKGACAGRSYGEKNASNPEALSKINDFTWLQDQWQVEKSQQ